MKFILGKKQYMTQIFTDNGTAIPATVISAGPLIVTELRTKEKDGYTAVQFGFVKKADRHINKAEKGKSERGGFRHVREVRTELKTTTEARELGSVVDVSVFALGDMVAVSGVTKGKGFQGVVKRHGFHGGPRSHGQKHSEREAGSIGGGGRAGGRVAKGMRMPGRMGGDRVTVKNLKIVAIDKDTNTILVSGAVPGRRGTLLEIRG